MGGLYPSDKSHGCFWLPAADGVSEVGEEWEDVFRGASAPDTLCQKAKWF
jgi:hypothetical protein